jgi:hypothetical protein
MLELGTVGEEEQEAGRRQAVDESVQKCLRLAVDPVEVLDDQEEGLDAALPEPQVLEGGQRALPALRRIERLPGGLLNRYLQQAEDGRQTRLEGRIKGLELGGDLVAECR